MKRILLAATIALCASMAEAAPTSYVFEYKGFIFQPGEYFDADLAISGKFTGEDLDNNDLLTLDEITAFSLDQRNVHLARFEYEMGGRVKFWAGAGSEYYQTYDLDSYAYYFQTDWPYNPSYEFSPETTFTITSAVPEPSSWAMLGGGLFGLALLARRRQKS